MLVNRHLKIFSSESTINIPTGLLISTFKYSEIKNSTFYFL